jgi:hypothetical protein
MPFTPFHFPPNALASQPLRRHVDVPMVLLANLAVDVEPLVATVLGLAGPPHGPVHTLIGGAVVGAAAGWVWWKLGDRVGRLFGDRYPLTLRTSMLSGVIGAWLHVLLDAVLYPHLQPFFPLRSNPLYVAGSGDVLHAVSAAALLPALLLAWRAADRSTVAGRLTAWLLGLSGAGMAVSVAAGVAP